jgi:hypothetical protein
MMRAKGRRGSPRPRLTWVCRMALTIDGLKRRDELVFWTAGARRIPVLTLPAGGYASAVRDTATIHCNTIVASFQHS